LGFLQDQFSRSSYWYLSEVDLFENYEDLKNKNEIDIVCVLDGQFHAVEVKRHVSVFVNKPGAVDKFVKVMDLLRPDVAMLSFEAFCGAEENINDIKMALAQATKEITRRIAPVKLVVIVADDVAGFNEHPPDLGWFGKRTQEFH
jgi:predicted RecB family endonuclease